MTADFFRATLTLSSRKTARRKVIMAKKKSKPKKRAVGKAKHTGVGNKVVKKKKRPAKTVSKKAKAHPKPAIAAKKVAKKKVVKPKSAAPPLPAPPVLEPPPVEHASISEPATPTDAEASAS
jgi:hypothetical protein